MTCSPRATIPIAPQMVWHGGCPGYLLGTMPSSIHFSIIVVVSISLYISKRGISFVVIVIVIGAGIAVAVLDFAKGCIR